MEALVTHMLATYGVWFTLVNSNLPFLGEARDRAAAKRPMLFSFLDCPICSGFWVSLLVAAITQSGFRDAALFTWAGAASTYLIETQMRRLTER